MRQSKGWVSSALVQTGLYIHVQDQVVTAHLSAWLSWLSRLAQAFASVQATAGILCSYRTRDSSFGLQCGSQPVWLCAADIARPSPASQAAGPAAQQPSTPEPDRRTLQEWVNCLVMQMGQSQGLDDARRRATEVLQAFQQALAQAHRKVCTDRFSPDLTGCLIEMPCESFCR